jgi:hypothetical protein
MIHMLLFCRSSCDWFCCCFVVCISHYRTRGRRSSQSLCLRIVLVFTPDSCTPYRCIPSFQNQHPVRLLVTMTSNNSPMHLHTSRLYLPQDVDSSMTRRPTYPVKKCCGILQPSHRRLVFLRLMHRSLVPYESLKL